MRSSKLLFWPLVFLALPAQAQGTAEASISSGDTAWMLVATALVLLMTPALAFFYGGLVRAKNALNTMMMSFIALGISGVLWAVLGYSLAFGEGSAWIGDFSKVLLMGVGLEPSGSIPHLLFMAFQGTFAIITAALISGAIVERMQFKAYLWFIGLWGLLVYAPIAHWVWGGGWLADLGALDFAGGAVVHVNAAAAAIGAVLFLGWFGFNGGSALASNESAALAFVNTMLAPAATLSAWAFLDLIRSGKVTAVGAATAIVVGLVAITPAAGFVPPWAALLIGALSALPSYFAILWRPRTRFDDSLDVFAAHGLGGASGALLTGVFAHAAWNGTADGLLFGNPGQVLVQLLSVVAVLFYSSVVSFLILKVLSLFMPVRAAAPDEARGLDVVLHGEEAYAYGEGAVLLLEHERANGTAPATAPRPQPATTA
jgi:Amt family ammonium transporter